MDEETIAPIKTTSYYKIIMKIAIQGLETSFHALAAADLFGNNISLVCCKNFKEVFTTLEKDEVQYAVVAIENSLYGSINEVYDLLLQHDFWIIAEAYKQISLQLLGLPDATLHDITDVYSQAPALAESEEFLNTSLAHAKRHEHSDTALAAKDIAHWGSKNNAAIASRAAAAAYCLSILSENIETHHHNYTRFIVLSKKPNDVGVGNKTSLTFQTKDIPGSLHAALGVFADKKINLSKLESRPIAGSVWRYMYYVDIACDFNDELLEALSRHAYNIRILGSYPAGAIDEIS